MKVKRTRKSKKESALDDADRQDFIRPKLILLMRTLFSSTRAVAEIGVKTDAQSQFLLLGVAHVQFTMHRVLGISDGHDVALSKYLGLVLSPKYIVDFLLSAFRHGSCTLKGRSVHKNGVKRQPAGFPTCDFLAMLNPEGRMQTGSVIRNSTINLGVSLKHAAQSPDVL